jgi:NADH-quinone oxidoreductase subunit G
LAASVPDLEFAHAVLVLDCEPVDAVPILELRIRKGVRRNGVTLAIATDRPSALDSVAAAHLRHTPGRGAELAWALAGALGGAGELSELAAAAGTSVAAVRSLARTLRSAGKEVVILYGERLLDGGSGGLLALADQLGIAGRDGAGLIGIPAAANGRGLREAGVLPNAGPGLTRPELAGGHDARQIAVKLASGELAAIYLLGVDPVRSMDDGAAWSRALDRATTVIAHASFLTAGIREHASVVFPSEASAEKDGTVTHPDGRLQRLRPAVGRPPGVYAEWEVLCDLATRLGGDLGVRSAGEASAALFSSVPFYKTLTLEALSGHGVRWPDLVGAKASAAKPTARAATPKPRRPILASEGRLILGSYRSIWAGPEVEASPALNFLSPKQRVELAPVDAARIGVAHGDLVLVSDRGAELEARVVLRDAAPAGTAFLEQDLDADTAGLLRGPHVEIRLAPEPVEPEQIAEALTGEPVEIEVLQV